MWVINGHKSVVLHGAMADLLIVTARTSGAPDSPQGITLFFVNPAEAGRGRAVTIPPTTACARRRSASTTSPSARNR